MTATTVEPEGAAAGRTADRSERAALVVFAVVVAVAFVLETYLGRRQWFSRDEWAFLADREIGDPGDLFRDHNTHWTTLPVVAYRLMWHVFGLRTYAPDAAMAVASHLACAVLLRVVMRRAAVGAWTATAAASLFALFGSGESNVVWGFQIAFTGALALGLGHMLLADHDGPLDRRDVLGIAFGVGSLACSGVGIVMAGAVTLATLVRRGWRVAAVHGGSARRGLRDVVDRDRQQRVRRGRARPSDRRPGALRLGGDARDLQRARPAARPRTAPRRDPRGRPPARVGATRAPAAAPARRDGGRARAGGSRVLVRERHRAGPAPRRRVRAHEPSRPRRRGTAPACARRGARRDPSAARSRRTGRARRLRDRDPRQRQGSRRLGRRRSADRAPLPPHDPRDPAQLPRE